MLENPVWAVRSLAAELDGRLAHLTPQAILRTVLEDVCPGCTAIVSSFGTESVALLHMAAMVDPAVPVIFLETGKHFEETLGYRERVVERLGLLNVTDQRPSPADVAREDPGGNLHACDPNACCALRKVRPLQDALAGQAAWITGRRRDQTPARRTMAVVEPDGLRLRVNPLAAWREADVEAYIEANALPRHPLISQGYPSVGCAPCTAPASGTDARSGRWAGLAKTECGIHLPR